ncbi:hypothetical protein [Sphingopyxis sp.]|uniref:hypothetical protein n=1 Tax=Sphingopyxis sp. TaxID=1908224 RepID=UPI002ED842B3
MQFYLARMAELEREREELTTRLAAAPQNVPDVHPGMAEICKSKAARLVEALEYSKMRLDAAKDIR